MDLPPHGRGRWFEPSIAHRAARQYTPLLRCDRGRGRARRVFRKYLFKERKLVLNFNPKTRECTRFERKLVARYNPAPRTRAMEHLFRDYELTIYSSETVNHISSGEIPSF